MTQKKIYPNPRFKSFEEEDEYWRTHDPLTEGYKATVHREPKTQKRVSYLAVRLTGEEITQLRNLAAQKGLGPSTFARTILLRAIEEETSQPARLTVDQLASLLKKANIQVVESQPKDPGRKKVAGVR